MKSVILHSDFNNFYASVEMLYDPSLRGRPVIVAGDEEARHGIVLAKNEIAKGLGIHTGQVLWEARQRCPELVCVPAHYDRYLRFSALAREIYVSYTDQVEAFGLDECWLDVTGSTQLFGSGSAIADDLRGRIRRELGLTVSVGVSFNKVFAKLGSDSLAFVFLQCSTERGFFQLNQIWKEAAVVKCLLKYQWVKLPRNQLPPGKGVMGAWARLASRAAFRNGQSTYCGHVNKITLGTWAGGVVGLKSILGIKNRQKALDMMDKLAALGYLSYELDSKTKKLTYQIKDWVVRCSGAPCMGEEAVYAKLVRKFVHFCSKTRMDIEGLSETTLEKFIQHGWIKTFGDLYELEKHKAQFVSTSGFGEKSFARLQAAVDKRRTCTLNQFIAGLGIPEVGRHAGAALCEYFHGSWDAFEQAMLAEARLFQKIGNDAKKYKFEPRQLSAVAAVVERVGA